MKRKKKKKKKKNVAQNIRASGGVKVCSDICHIEVSLEGDN